MGSIRKRLLLLGVALLAVLGVSCGGAGNNEGAEAESTPITGPVPKPPDPCALLTAQQIEAVVGEPVKRSGHGSTDSEDFQGLSCTYRWEMSGGGLGEVSVGTGSFRDVSDARRLLGELRGMEPEDAGIEGLPASSFTVGGGNEISIWVIESEPPFGTSVELFDEQGYLVGTDLQLAADLALAVQDALA